ncbi:MAG: Rpn family recombination-promoting nuclease/putative transposase, partial [Symploca sp. SIO1B1]|nr:Rpn family recombination-promoting nuclease/putative transposase [Symploca sp. SIO1B1]
LFHTVELKNQKGKVFYDKLKFIYVELPKFTKTVDQLESHFDKWLFLLKHLSELESPPEALQEVVFDRLFEVSEISNFSAVEQEAYENSLKYYRDLQNVVATSREEGIEEGRQEGFEQGRQEGRQEGREQTKIEIALSCIQQGLDTETIMAITQLSREDVAQFKIQNSKFKNRP